LVGYATLGLSPVSTTVADKPADRDTLATVFAEHLARMVDNVVAAMGEDDARVRELGQELIA